MKIIFMGTPDFAVPTLQTLIEAPEHEIVAVFSQAPKQKGRKLQITQSPVHILAEKNNIPVYTPSTLKTDDAQESIRNIEADVIVVVAYGFIIPKTLLSTKKYGCLNIHPSLLPRHRGAAPLQHTILDGDTKSSVCIMQMDEGLDTGPILREEKFSLAAEMTVTELHDKCAHLGAKLLIDTLKHIDTCTPTQQSQIGVTYAHKITKEHGRIDWQSMDAITIERMVRGLNPWPGVFFIYNDMNIKILKCEICSNNDNAKPGTIIDDKLTIACKEQALRITELQKPGKRPMTSAEFLRGMQLPSGTSL